MPLFTELLRIGVLRGSLLQAPPHSPGPLQGSSTTQGGSPLRGANKRLWALFVVTTPLCNGPANSAITHVGLKLVLVATLSTTSARPLFTRVRGMGLSRKSRCRILHSPAPIDPGSLL